MTESARMPGAAASRPGRQYFRLFLVSFVLLFLELACIRWFGSMVVFLTFFTNVVLLASFLGMAVGSMAATAHKDWAAAVLPWLLISCVLAWATLYVFEGFGHLLVDVGGQGSPQQVYFGTEYRALDPTAFAIPIEVLAAVFFGLIAFVFVGVGQVLGRAFRAVDDQLLGYVCNIAGSLAGIAAFALVSYLRTPPVVWFGVAGGLWVFALIRPTRIQVARFVTLVLFLGLIDFNAGSRSWRLEHASGSEEVLLWSPYYKIQYRPAEAGIATNNIGHQKMVRVTTEGSAYNLPYLLNRDAGGAPFRNVLVIGAGSGNDVAAALANGASHVDAVEIDPTIRDIGRAAHPNRPYDDPRVTVYIDDGRSFLRKTTTKYDLIVYALVDSLVLHSGYSSIRLESFLFTQQAFRDIAARLTDHGLFVAYNFFRQGWIVGRVDRMAESAFLQRPLVISLPHVERITAGDPQFNRLTMILSGRDALEPIRAAFGSGRSFWLNDDPRVHKSINAFGSGPPALGSPGSWKQIAPSSVDTAGIGRLPTDDWPYLYLREPAIPAVNVRSTLLLAVVSAAIFLLVSPVRLGRVNRQMFFLGAGFMLLETKSVVHLALLFGSTWIVNSIVFFAILTMILASNAFVLAVRPQKVWPFYGLLFASLALNLALPLNSFLALSLAQKLMVSLAAFVPIFFAGIVFGTAFQQSPTPDVDYGSNIAGALAGGFAESISLIIGFNHLLVLVLILYIASAVWARRLPAVGVVTA